MPLFQGDSNWTAINALNYNTLLYIKPRTLREVRNMFRMMERSDHQFHPDDPIMECFEHKLKDGTITMSLLQSLKEATESARVVCASKDVDYAELSMAAHYEAQIDYYTRKCKSNADNGNRTLLHHNVEMLGEYLENWSRLSASVKELFAS